MYEEEYRRKTVSVEYALSLLRSGDLVAIGGYGNEPKAFLKRLHTVADGLEGVKICACAFRDSYPFLEDDSCAGKIDVLLFPCPAEGTIPRPDERVYPQRSAHVRQLSDGQRGKTAALRTGSYTNG